MTQSEKGRIFRALHAQDHAFIIPNPFDAGTAKLLTQAGFEALATTSAGFAFSVGRQDGTIARDEMITHAAAIVAATDLPVSADLENGYGHSAEYVAETIRMAAAAGLAGCSIEDMTRQPEQPVYEHEHAIDRIRAAAQIAHTLPFPFTLTARCENYLVGRPDLKDTIKRLQSYQDAGADVLFAPGITTREDIAEVVRSVDRPVNVIAGLRGMGLTLADLSALGVKRISVGSALSRTALTAFLRAAREMQEHGAFSFDEAIPYHELNAMFP